MVDNASGQPDDVVDPDPLGGLSDAERSVIHIEDDPAPSPNTTPVPAAQRSSVSIGGQEFDVNPELKAALDGRESQFTQKLNENSRELGELRQWQQTITQPPNSQPAGPDMDALMFEDPTKYRELMSAEIKEDLRKEYSQQRGLDQFWSGFYTQNKDLEGENTIVESIANKNWTHLGTLPVADATSKLAELTRKELMRIQSKFKAGGNPETLPGGRTFTESPGSPSPAPPVDDDEGPSSITDALKLRREAMNYGG